MTLTTSASLDALRAAARTSSYQGEVPDKGWGAISDEARILGQVGRARIVGGAAQILEETAFAPRRFVGRLYWDQVDKTALRAVGGDERSSNVFVLQAADVILASTFQENSYLVLATSANSRYLNQQIAPQISTLAVLAGDDNARVFQDDSTAHLGDDDLFLWLLYRFHNEPQLTDAIRLTALRSIATADPFDRAAKLTKGADLDRPELLALVGGRAIRFGPARFAFNDDQLKLMGEVELHLDGMFTPMMTESAYDTSLGRAQLGPRLVDDLAFKVLPEIRGAFSADNDWRLAHRDSFMATARTLLSGKLLPGGCPNCGHDLSAAVAQ